MWSQLNRLAPHVFVRPGVPPHSSLFTRACDIALRKGRLLEQSGKVHFGFVNPLHTLLRIIRHGPNCLLPRYAAVNAGW